MQIQKFLHILNPNTRYRGSVKKYFRKNSQIPHVWVERTSHPTHLETVVEWGLQQGFQNFSVWGGDGSFSRVVQALYDRKALPKATVALLPVGTGNDFSRKFQFPSWKKLLPILFSERTEVISVDIGAVELPSKKRIFMNNAGFGRTPQSIGTPHPNPLSDIFSFHEKKIQVESDSGVSQHFETLKIFFAIIFNSPYFNKGLYFDKQISPIDGMLQAVMVPPQNRWKLLFRFLKGRAGSSLSDRRDQWTEGHTLKVESQDLLYPQVDGESVGPQGVNSVQFSILEEKLSLLVPKGAVSTWA